MIDGSCRDSFQDSCILLIKFYPVYLLVLRNSLIISSTLMY